CLVPRPPLPHPSDYRLLRLLRFLLFPRIRIPRPLRDGRYEILHLIRIPRERALLLGALVGRHEQLHDLQAGVEVELGLLSIQKLLDEVAILALVAVLGRLVADEGHQALLRILLLDEVLALLTLHLAAEEEARAAVQRVVVHRILGAEELGAQPEAGADESPRRGHL